MNDNDNIKELIGARLEEIHLSETMADTMPSDEEILRWETLADARRAQKQRNKRRLLSMVAVFLLAIVVGVAVIVSPPDAEAGGDGRAVIVGNEDGVTYTEYEFVKDIPFKVQKKFVFIEATTEGYDTEYVQHMKNKSIEQIYVLYETKILGEVGVTEIISKDNISLEINANLSGRKEIWDELEVYITEEVKGEKKKTYCFVYNNIFVSIHVEKDNKYELRKIIEETF